MEAQKETSARSDRFLRFLEKWLWPILQKIFRIEVSGLENLNAGPALWIANHNSGALIESHSLLFLTRQSGIKAYGLNHQALFLIPVVGKYFRLIGAVTASKKAAQEVLASQSALVIFPGGNRQALRPWSERHQNSFPWAKGWADIAVEAQVPVVPIKFIGTHSINPILVTSRWLSKILILPALLKVTYFPISLSQILWTVAGIALLSFLGGSAALTALAAYFIFCFTPLVPIWPAKVRIKIYPALQPGEDFIDSESLRDTMSQVLDRNDYPQGPRQKYKLNGIERFMLAHEAGDLRYNSQFIFEFQGVPQTEKILQTTEQWIQRLPFVRSIVQNGFYQCQRYIYEQPWFTARDLFQFESSMSQAVLDDFCYQKFDLAFQSPVRFLLQTDGQSSRMAFCCHHSIFDGAGQAFAFELWAKLYNGQSPAPVSVVPFHYRSVIRKLGWRKTMALLWENFQLRAPRSQTRLANFLEKADSGCRKVSSKIYYLNETHDFLRENYIPHVAQAIDQTLAELGQDKEPLLLYAPTGLRWVMKIHSSFQNAVVSQIFFLKRNLSFENLQKRIQEKLKADIIIANSKFIFGTLPVGKITSSKRFKAQIEKFHSPHSIASATALVVTAVFPKSFPVPKDWVQLRIAGRGTLSRSPPVGVIMTGLRGKETLTIEYIPSLVSEETVQKLARNLLSPK